MVTRTAQDLLDRARGQLERLTPQQAWASLADDGALLVDIRCGELRSEDGVVPGSLHAPFSVLYWRADPSSGHDDPRISRGDRRLILLCAHGYSSSLAAATLQELGHAGATDVIGGFEAWREAGLPIAKGPAAT